MFAYVRKDGMREVDWHLVFDLSEGGVWAGGSALRLESEWFLLALLATVRDWEKFPVLPGGRALSVPLRHAVLVGEREGGAREKRGAVSLQLSDPILVIRESGRVFCLVTVSEFIAAAAARIEEGCTLELWRLEKSAESRFLTEWKRMIRALEESPVSPYGLAPNCS